MSKPISLKIAGTGSALPRRVMTNKEFEQFLDTSDEWIRARTGIRERRVCGEGETTAQLGVEAGRAAIADAGCRPDDIDLIICATISPEVPFPATACFIQDGLGVRNIPAFDLSAACSGFIYGLVVAGGLIESGVYRRVLLIGSENMTRVCDFEDRGSCILFGDGAGAAVITPANGSGSQLLHSLLHCDGSEVEMLWIPAGGARQPTSIDTVQGKLHYVQMKGREVFKFAVKKMEEVVEQTLCESGVRPEQIKLLIPHQSNLRIIEFMRERMGLPKDRVYVNIDRLGNTSAASIPIALDEARRNGQVAPGDLILFLAVGAGMTWASALVRY
ncbi:MAG TPA: beta-ketoacyl-ACP synthase III [Phycisphaerae bacterium]|nr:beta-ketoacyl-ACP synthase III [Phycisphaerae bacterium]